MPSSPSLRGPVWNSTSNWRFECCGHRRYLAAVQAGVACEGCKRWVSRPPMSTPPQDLAPCDPWPGTSGTPLGQQELFG